MNLRRWAWSAAFTALIVSFCHGQASRAPSETVTPVSDSGAVGSVALQQAVSRGSSETTALSASVAAAAQHSSAAPAETSTTSASVARALGHGVSLSETMTLFDLTASARHGSVASSETVSVSASVARQQISNRNPYENLPHPNPPLPVFEATMTLGAEIASFADSASNDLPLSSRNISETMSTTDAASHAAAVVLTENIYPYRLTDRASTQTLGHGYSAALPEALPAAGAALCTVVTTYGPAETLAVTDAAVATAQHAYSTVLGEMLANSSSVAPVEAMSRSRAETLSLSASATAPAAHQSPAVEALSNLSSIAATGGHAVARSETLANASQVAAAGAHATLIVQASSLSDSIVRAAAIGRTPSDAHATLDAVSVQGPQGNNYSASLSEHFVNLGTVAEASAHAVEKAESVSTTDSAGRAGRLNAAASESMLLVDAFLANQMRSVAQNESMPGSSAVTRAASLNAASNEVLQMYDSVSVSKGGARTRRFMVIAGS